MEGGRGCQPRVAESGWAQPLSSRELGIERPRLAGRAAPLARGRHPHRDEPATEREDQAVAGPDRAARLVQPSFAPLAVQPHPPLLNEAGGEAAGLEESRAPEPNV